MHRKILHCNFLKIQLRNQRILYDSSKLVWYSAETFRINSCFLNLSRRAVDKAILEGRINKNGINIMDLGSKVTKGDELTFDRKVVKWEDYKFGIQNENLRNGSIYSSKEFVYIKVWKPKGYICSTEQNFNGNPIGYKDILILSLLPKTNCRLFPIGRLDKDSSGIKLISHNKIIFK